EPQQVRRALGLIFLLQLAKRSQKRSVSAADQLGLRTAPFDQICRVSTGNLSITAVDTDSPDTLTPARLRQRSRVFCSRGMRRSSPAPSHGAIFLQYHHVIMKRGSRRMMLRDQNPGAADQKRDGD